MTPDLLKIDIESFEAELFETSRSLIEAHRPRLALELHVRKLRERGKHPEEIASMLYELGYRIFPGKRDITALVEQGNVDGVARGCMVHEADPFWEQ